MKEKEEPAEALLTLEPEVETNLKEDGFLSALFKPETDAYPGKVLILVGGSDGYFCLTRLIAEQFAASGLTVLALAYWGKEGLPTALQRIPLEYAEKAALWLKARGYEKIGIWGISMGAEFSLLAASLLPEQISCCVGVCPISICTQALQKKNKWHKRMKLLEGSVFTFRGQDLPLEALSFHKKQVLLDSLRGKELTLRSCYEAAVNRKNPETEIPVEKMAGPLLLLAPDRDSMWPSKESAERLILRRKKQGLTTEYFHYAYASHLLIPYKLKSRRAFRLEREYPDRCWKSDVDAFQKTLVFLKNNW